MWRRRRPCQEAAAAAALSMTETTTPSLSTKEGDQPARVSQAHDGHNRVKKWPEHELIMHPASGSYWLGHAHAKKKKEERERDEGWLGGQPWFASTDGQVAHQENIWLGSCLYAKQLQPPRQQHSPGTGGRLGPNFTDYGITNHVAASAAQLIRPNDQVDCVQLNCHQI